MLKTVSFFVHGEMNDGKMQVIGLFCKVMRKLKKTQILEFFRDANYLLFRTLYAVGNLGENLIEIL